MDALSLVADACRSMSIRPIQKSSRLHPKPPPPVAEDPPPVVEDPPPPADGKHAHAHAMAHMPHKGEECKSAGDAVSKRQLNVYAALVIQCSACDKSHSPG